MKKNSAQVFAAFLALFVAGFLFQMPVYAAKIVSGGTTRYYIQVQAERGDSPYSIARMFVDSDAAGKRNPTEVAADFLALNGIRAYNKKGNPLIYPGEIYLVPTQQFYKAMSTFIAGLDAKEEVIAPTIMAVVEAKKGALEAFYLTLASQKDFILGILVLALLTLFICFVRLGDKVKTVKTEEVTVPVVRADEPPKIPSLEKTLAPLESPVEGITLGDRVVNALRPYRIEEAVGALETDVIPVPGNNRHIKLRSLPESFKRHPEWRGELLHNIITRAEGEVREKKQGEQAPDDTGRPQREHPVPCVDHRGL